MMDNTAMVPVLIITYIRLSHLRRPITSFAELHVIKTCIILYLDGFRLDINFDGSRSGAIGPRRVMHTERRALGAVMTINLD